MKKLIAALLTFAMCLSITACSPGGATNSTAGDAGTGETSGTQETTGGGDSAGRDSINVCVASDPLTLAPNGQSGDGYTYAALYDQLWNLSKGEITYRVGTGFEMEDDTHYLITIRSGIKDTAGNELTASDVLYSIELAQNGSAGYPGAARYIDVENSEVVDDTTLRVALTQPCSYQMNALSMINLVTKASYEASSDGMVTTPVSTGPYMLNEYVTGSYVSMDYNPDYWGWEESGEPEVKHITVNFIVEASQRANVLMTGESDFSYIINYTDMEALNSAENTTTNSDTSLNTTTLFYNCSSESPLNSLDFRKAVSYAINNASIVTAAVGGYGEVAKTNVSPNFSDYNPAFDEIAADTDYYAYNVDAAKECLAASGVPEGTTLQIIYDATPGHDAVAQIVQACLAEIGINAELTQYPDTKMDVLLNQPGDWDIGVQSWTNYPAQSALATYVAFVSSNYLHMEGELYDTIMGDIDKAVAASTQEELDEDMMKLMEDMYEYVPVYGLYNECRLVGYNSDLNVVWKCQDYPLYYEWSFQ